MGVGRLPNRRLSAIAAVAVSIGFWLRASATPLVAQGGSVDATLAAAGRYVAQLAHDLDGVVMAEDYLQLAQAQIVQGKRIKSDLAFLADDTFGLIEFRDTYEVDGKPVPDRQARVVELFSHPSGAALEQARRIVKEGARFNLAAPGAGVDRTINVPLAALMFLRAANHARSTFSREGTETVGGDRMAVVAFREVATPRLIGTPDNAASQGRFWIHPETGQVRRTLFQLAARRGTTVVNVSIRVDYTDVRSLGLWLPRVMEEDYSGAVSLTGRANYSNYRKFNVVVDEKGP